MFNVTLVFMKTKKSKYTPGRFQLKVKKSLTGKGLFALENIPKDKCVIEYIGKDIKKDDQDDASGKYLFATGKNIMIDGNIPENIARYINHSCRPNCEARGPKGHVYILSLKNIRAGVELTYDYGKEYFDAYINPKGCKCPKCQKA